LTQVCPGQPVCTGRGTCSDSTCTCDQGKQPHSLHFIGGSLRNTYRHLAAYGKSVFQFSHVLCSDCNFGIEFSVRDLGLGNS